MCGKEAENRPEFHVMGDSKTEDKVAVKPGREVVLGGRTNEEGFLCIAVYLLCWPSW